MKTLVLTLALAVGLVAATSAQADMSGGWTLTFEGPNGPVEAAATFKQDGEKITGTLTGPQGDAPVAGTIKDKAFTFTMSVQTQNGELAIKISGEVAGETLTGTFDFGQGSGNFTGKRKPK